MGAMKRLHDDLEDGSVFVDIEPIGQVSMIRIATALGNIRITGASMVVHFTDLEGIATDGRIAFPGVDDLVPPAGVILIHNETLNTNGGRS